MCAITVDQVWSILATHSRRRVEFKITHIAKVGSDELRAYGIPVGGGKEVSFTVRALSKGLRGARLVRHADGHEPYKPGPVKGYKTAENTATASDYRREKAPKGVATASPRMEEAFAMREQGSSLDEIASRFDITPATASSWLSKVRQKREDERSLAMLRST